MLSLFLVLIAIVTFAGVIICAGFPSSVLLAHAYLATFRSETTFPDFDRAKGDPRMRVLFYIRPA